MEDSEKKKVIELLKEMRNKEEVSRNVSDDRSLKWMYKQSDLIDREEYLLGKSIDKSFEVLNNGGNLDNSVGRVSEQSNVPKRLLEKTECTDQVDVAKKILEDPLYAIKQKEMEARKQLLNNPVKLKQIKQMLLERNKKKESNKEHDKKKSKKNKLSVEKLDFEILKLLKKFSDKKIKKVLNKIMESDSDYSSESSVNIKKKSKKNLKKKRKRSLSSSTDTTDSESKATTTSDSSDDTEYYKKRKRKLKMSKESSQKKKKIKSRHSSTSDSDSDSSEECNRKKSRSKKSNSAHLKSKRNRHKKNSRKSTSSSSSNQSSSSSTDSPRDSSDNINRERKKQMHKSHKKAKVDEKNIGEQTKIKKSLEKSVRGKIEKSNKDESSSRNEEFKKNYGLMMPDGSVPVADSRKTESRKYDKPKEIKSKYVPPPVSKPLSEKEQKKKLKQMLEDAKIRKKEREKNIANHRKIQAQEEESKCYDTDFMRRQMSHLTSQGTMADRIKSNINNLQRSKFSMDSNFVRK